MNSSITESVPARTRIEPNTIKRRDVGLRAYDPARAFPGYRLFAPDGKPDNKKSMSSTCKEMSSIPGKCLTQWD
jgi:hypothetical protein